VWRLSLVLRPTDDSGDVVVALPTCAVAAAAAEADTGHLAMDDYAEVSPERNADEDAHSGRDLGPGHAVPGEAGTSPAEADNVAPEDVGVDTVENSALEAAADRDEAAFAGFVKASTGETEDDEATPGAEGEAERAGLGMVIATLGPEVDHTGRVPARDVLAILSLLGASTVRDGRTKGPPDGNVSEAGAEADSLEVVLIWRGTDPEPGADTVLAAHDDRGADPASNDRSYDVPAPSQDRPAHSDGEKLHAGSAADGAGALSDPPSRDAVLGRNRVAG
jgi:hypothetical protein